MIFVAFSDDLVFDAYPGFRKAQPWALLFVAVGDRKNRINRFDMRPINQSINIQISGSALFSKTLLELAAGTSRGRETQPTNIFSL
jgi:hypothetical protein